MCTHMHMWSLEHSLQPGSFLSIHLVCCLAVQAAQINLKLKSSAGLCFLSLGLKVIAPWL